MIVVDPISQQNNFTGGDTVQIETNSVNSSKKRLVFKTPIVNLTKPCITQPSTSSSFPDGDSSLVLNNIAQNSEMNEAFTNDAPKSVKICNDSEHSSQGSPALKSVRKTAHGESEQQISTVSVSIPTSIVKPVRKWGQWNYPETMIFYEGIKQVTLLK